MWFRPFFSLAWGFKADALCWGVLLCLFAKTSVYSRYRLPKQSNKYVAMVIGLMPLLLLPLLAAQIQGVGNDTKLYGVATVATICALIVWIASFDNHFYSTGGIYSKIMLYLGSRSYSLYLSHLIVFYLVTTLLASELTYRVVETKFRHKGPLIAARMLSK
jgi:peptidoglycan/LPS O-acetylase OafA/YrhL